MNKIDNIYQTIIEFTLLFFLGSTFNEFLSDTLDETSIFDSLGLISLGLCFGSMVGVIIYEGITKRNRGSLYYIFIILSIMGICIYTAINYSEIKKVDSSSVFMEFSHVSSGFNLRLELRQDSTYLFTQNNSIDIYRGKYSKQDSIIKLDRTKIGRIIESNVLLIRKGQGDKAILYQVDKDDNQYRIIKKAFPFILTASK
ncbi:hypothetical protein ACE193_19150 [Bernardetia sp. OM2101]|uniref:hypothetical protein n=1 Tax=Bernardetia sp. OM2101 TaxID=3344876 RepID=UPI0035D0F7B4